MCWRGENCEGFAPRTVKDVGGSSFWESLADYLADFVADRAAAMAFPAEADEENREERPRVPLHAADGDEESTPMDSAAQEAKDD